MSRLEPEITPAVPDDARELALILNDDDRREVAALSGRDPAEVLIDGMQRSTEAWTGRVDGQLVCIWGVGPQSLIGETGVPWLLGSDLVQKHAPIFLRLNREYIARWRQTYPVLANVVDARHVRALRWLRWLGFEIGAPTVMGVQRLPFHPFVMRA